MEKILIPKQEILDEAMISIQKKLDTLNKMAKFQMIIEKIEWTSEGITLWIK